MRLTLYQIDAFTETVFGGNPAAVVPLETWLPDAVMQRIATENNLAETAFFVPDPERGGFGLRWFTPALEVPLCGHATLASAFVLFSEIDPARTTAEFHTQSGPLIVTRRGDDRLQMDFPRHALTPADAPPALLAGLQALPREVYYCEANPNFYAVYDTEASLRALAPDFAALLPLGALGVCATAPGTACDFVSRYFAPGFGIPEDPVTGSTHCALAPYWAERLGRRELSAQQVSPRGGEIFCTVGETRVLIAGQAVKYLSGEIFI